MRPEVLTVIKGGLSRQRQKGGALKDALFDLLNGYVTTEKTLKSRPGTRRVATLPAGTVGLVFHNNSLNVFASSDVGAMPAGYTLNIVRAPDNAALSKIHFAEPFLGNLYVVAEFADGDIYHFWLQDAETWEANRAFELADIVTPTTANAYRYTPKRNGQPNPTWTPGASRQVGDRVEPTVFNGYYFEVVQVFGSNPRSATTEPAWVNGGVVPGQRFAESVDGTYTPPPATPPRDRDRRPPVDDDVDERYGGGRARRNEVRWARSR